jgi:hypothetical protein
MSGQSHLSDYVDDITSVGGHEDHRMRGDRLIDLISRFGFAKIHEWHAGPEYFEWGKQSDPGQSELDPVYWVQKLTYENWIIWHLEDHCRSGVLHKIGTNKPLIDRHNQARNDSIEELDKLFILRYQAPVPAGLPLGEYSVETLGSIIDRLLITRLKWYHTFELDPDGAKHSERLNTLLAQMAFLSVHISRLFDEMVAGTKFTRSFRQLKMYNDAALNQQYVTRHETQ